MSRVLVLRAAAVGDFVATLPVLHRLAASRALTVITAARYRALLGPVGEIWDVDAAETTRRLAGDLSGFDLGVAYTAGGGEMLRRAGVREVRVGAPLPAAGIAVHDHLWAPLAGVLGPRDRDPVVFQDPVAVAALRARWSGAAPVVISPGSGGARKRWAVDRWAAVADELAAIGVPTLWVAGPVEEDWTGWGSPRWTDLDLAGLAALAAMSRAWLCPDSGPAHVARAAGCRVGVVFNGVTDPRCWAPPGARVFGADATPSDLAAWAVSAA